MAGYAYAYYTIGSATTIQYILVPQVYVTGIGTVTTGTIFLNQTTVWGNQWIYNYPYQSASAPTPETPEQKLARAVRAAAAEAAASRADQLLLSLLSPDQATEYQRDKRFELRIGARTYRIHKGRAQNIQLIENGKAVAKYCAHPDIWTPDGDAMLAQMLMLKTDEARFLKIANRTALQ